METSHGEPNGHETKNGGYGQKKIYGSLPFLDPVIIKEWIPLDELPVNRTNKKATPSRV